MISSSLAVIGPAAFLLLRPVLAGKEFGNTESTDTCTDSFGSTVTIVPEPTLTLGNWNTPLYSIYLQHGQDNTENPWNPETPMSSYTVPSYPSSTWTTQYRTITVTYSTSGQLSWPYPANPTWSPPSEPEWSVPGGLSETAWNEPGSLLEPTLGAPETPSKSAWAPPSQPSPYEPFDSCPQILVGTTIVVTNTITETTTILLEAPSGYPVSWGQYSTTPSWGAPSSPSWAVKPSSPFWDGPSAAQSWAESHTYDFLTPTPSYTGPSTFNSPPAMPSESALWPKNSSEYEPASGFDSTSTSPEPTQHNLLSHSAAGSQPISAPASRSKNLYSPVPTESDFYDNGSSYSSPKGYVWTA